MRLGGGKMACSPPPPSLPLLLLLGIGSAVAQSGYDIKEFDTDESGALEPKEFARFLQSTPAKGQPKDEIRSMFKQINTNNDNGVDQSEFDEFLNQMAKDKPPPPPPPPKQKSAKKDKAFTSLQKRQIKSLQDFYKKHAPDKDPDAVANLAKKAMQRSGETWYADMCAQLADKYGENPAAYMESADAKSGGKEKAAKDSASDADSEKTSESSEAEPESTGTARSEAAQALRTKAGTSRKTRKHILRAYYGKHAPEKMAEDIDKIIAKREGKTTGPEWFFDMCDKLTQKYGDDVFEFVAQAEQKSTPDEPETSSDEEVKAEGADHQETQEIEQEEESSTPPPDRELSPREKLIERLTATAQGIDDLDILEEIVKATEKAAEESAQQSAEEQAAKAEEERIKAEEEAKVKAERKAAARARAEKAKAEAAERRAKEEAAEEAALELETFDPVNIDDEGSMVLVDAEVMDWLAEQRLSDYTSRIVSYGGKLSELMRRIKSDDIAGFGMSTAESARLKKALKKLRKDARAAAEEKAEEDAKSADGEEAKDDGAADAEEEAPNNESNESGESGDTESSE